MGYEAGAQSMGLMAGNLSKQSGLRLRTLVIPIETDLNYLVAGVLPPAAGNNLTIVSGGYLPYPQSIAGRLNTDANVINRNLTLRVTGLDQFGAGKTEDLVWTAIPASQNEVRLTLRAYSRVSQVSVIISDNIQAGDTVEVGITVDALVRYGLGIEIKDASDIVGGTRMVAGVPTAVDLSTGTIDTSRMTIRNIAGVVANDTLRLTVYCGRDFSG